MPAPDLGSPKYIAGFTVALCGVCAIFVASAAVGLKDRQDVNKRVDRMSKVLGVAGLLKADESLSNAKILERYQENIVERVIDMSTGEYVDDVEASTFDMRAAAKDPARSKPAPDNAAQVQRIPEHGVVYHVVKNDDVETVILPISGYGLWSTMYGFLAMDDDGNTIEGITFYEHGETPGLGGEVENPRWQSLWKGRKAFDADAEVVIAVIKGAAKGPEEDPHRVDGISGATITSRGVTATLEFWLGPQGYGPYLAHVRAAKDDGKGGKYP